MLNLLRNTPKILKNVSDFKPQTHYGWIGTWKDFDHGVILDKFEEMENISETQKRCPPIMMPRLNSKGEIQKYYTDHQQTFGYNQCVSIFMTIEIDSNGDVSLCPRLSRLYYW